MSVIEAERKVNLTYDLPAKQPETRFRDYDGGLKLQDLLTILRRRWWVCLLATLVSLGGAVAYYLLVPPTYESYAQLLIMRKDPKLAAQGVGAARVAEVGVSEDLLSTQIQLIQSRRIVSEALAEHGLDKLESILVQLDEDETPTDYVIENLHVTRGGEGQAADADVVNVAFRHSSQVETKAIVEAIIARYQVFLDETFRDVNNEAAELITTARTELAAELTSAEAAYQEYREEAPILWNGDISTNVHRQRFDELQAELSQINIQTNEASARLAVVERVVKEQDLAGVSDFERLVVIDEKNAERVGILLAVQQGEVETAEFQSRQPERMENARSEYQSLLMLQMRENRLLEDFGPRHPEVESIKKQISIAREFINTKGKNLGVGEESMIDPKELQDAYVILLRRDLETLRQRETELIVSIELEEQKAKELVKYELAGESLRQGVDRQQELYDAVVNRLREINLAKDYGGVINEVIADAEIGIEVWPSLPICLALGILGGIVLSGAGATIGEARDRSFKAPEEIKEALGIHLLATIPVLHPSTDRQLLRSIRASGSKLDQSLYAQHAPQSRESELFRVLRTSVFFRSDADDVRVIMFSSPDPGDGKTTVVGNLAVSIAQSGRSVLVIDADMRRPKVHSIFGLECEKGLSQVLSGEEELHDAIQSTEVSNLNVMTCGSNATNPAEILSSSEFSDLLGVVREQFDFVLIDCPPVLAVADPCIVAPRADGVVMVLRMTNKCRPKAIECKSLLDEAGGTIVGTVVNRWNSGGQSRYGEYGKGYYAAKTRQDQSSRWKNVHTQ